MVNKQAHNLLHSVVPIYSLSVHMLNMFPIRPRAAINGNYLHTYEGTGRKKKYENGKHINATVIEHVHDSHLGLFQSLSN